jgi:hypothetical protein
MGHAATCSGAGVQHQQASIGVAHWHTRLRRDVIQSATACARVELHAPHYRCFGRVRTLSSAGACQNSNHGMCCGLARRAAHHQRRHDPIASGILIRHTALLQIRDCTCGVHRLRQMHNGTAQTTATLCSVGGGSDDEGDVRWLVRLL